MNARSHGEGRRSQALSANMLREMGPTALPGLEGSQLPSGCPQEAPPSPGKLEVSLVQLGHPRVSTTPSSPSRAHEVSSHLMLRLLWAQSPEAPSHPHPSHQQVLLVLFSKYVQNPGTSHPLCATTHLSLQRLSPASQQQTPNFSPAGQACESQNTSGALTRAPCNLLFPHLPPSPHLSPDSPSLLPLSRLQPHWRPCWCSDTSLSPYSRALARAHSSAECALPERHAAHSFTSSRSWSDLPSQ